MKTKHTNKSLLLKGLQTMAMSLVCMFAGPTLLYIALGNKEKPLYIPLLVIAIMVCIVAVYFAFRGLILIHDSLFEKKKS